MVAFANPKITGSIIGITGLSIVFALLIIPTFAKQEPMIIQTIQTSNNTGVTSLKSANNAIGLNATTGNILLTPKFQLLCQNTLNADSTSLSCNNFTARNYLIYTIYTPSCSATCALNIRYNSDSGNNYAIRYEANGATSVTIVNTSASSCNQGDLTEINCYVFTTNVSNKPKLGNTYTVIEGNSGAGNAPNSFEEAMKWQNTNSQITSISVNTLTTVTLQAGAIITVWGYD